MRLGDLDKYGIPERIIRVWRDRQGDQLLPVQSRAIRQGLLDEPEEGLRPRNMIVTAPTSAGKSFCAELAAMKALSGRQKAVLLFPLKSLADEKYRLFERTYGPQGVRCLVVTGDHPENDERFVRGDYHVALAIYEKFDLALTSRLGLLQNTGLLVVDEIQMISESGRGAVLERLLTKVLASGYYPRLLGLSAALVDRKVQPLVDWLEATLVEETQRPRDLIRGVAAEGKFSYRSYNDCQDGSEPFARFDPFDPDGGSVQSLARQIENENKTTLIFLKSRSDSVNLAMRLATLTRHAPAENALQRLRGEEPSFLLRSLTQALSHGVAFHNSDLSRYQRQVVEEAFTVGEISILCSTTTLALGVNLAADTVYLETVKYTSGLRDSRPELMPISRAEFDNMTGRAGRLGQGDSRPGRAIVIAETAFDSEVLWDTYIAPSSPKPIESAWPSMAIEDWALNMIVSGLAGRSADLDSLFGRTLWFTLRHDRPKDAGLKAALIALQADALVVVGQDDSLVPTPAGSAVACAGLSVKDGVHYLRFLREGGSPETVFGWTCLALSGSKWRLPAAILSWYEQANNWPVKMLYQRFDHSLEEAVCLLPQNHRREPLSHRAAAALKAALLLDEWCRLVGVQKLEERFRMHLGQIQSLGRTAAHLVAALAALIRATDRESDRSRLLAQHAFSLRFGLPPSFETMHRHLDGVLRRSDLAAIHKAGLENLEELAGQSDEQLAEIIKDDDKVVRIHRILDDLKEEVDMQPSILEARMPPGQRPQLIEIDGSYEADRYLVRINGFPVRLTGKSFKYLTKLAWSRVNDDSGWVYKEDIEVGFNQARYLYRMKNEINAGFKSGWPIIENNRLGYYRLHIDPANIKLNMDNLRSHPDYELRSLFEREAGSGTMN